jgi:hypothetical protein
MIPCLGNAQFIVCLDGNKLAMIISFEIILEK